MKISYASAALLILLVLILGVKARAENISKDEAKKLETFLREKLGGNLPKDAKVTVKGYEESPIKGFKKGSIEVVASGKSGDIPFLISPDKRYVVFGDTIDTQTFKNSEVAGLKKGAIPLGRQQIPILVSEDGRYLMLGELVEFKIGNKPK
ncbi:MAG TPA: hypothetical protein VGA94_04860 [Thermodesulfobacteriota bacterium]